MWLEPCWDWPAEFRVWETGKGSVEMGVGVAADAFSTPGRWKMTLRKKQLVFDILLARIPAVPDEGTRVSVREASTARAAPL